jgi:CRP-like cAMP-binding protein
MLPPQRHRCIMGLHTDNHLLARLNPATLAALKADLTIAHLAQGYVLNETHAIVRKVYFPHGGIISCVVELVGGGAIETGMIGNDGQFGAGPALDDKVSLNLVIMQIAGDASVMDADKLRDLALHHPTFRKQLMSYEQFFLAQVQQTAACNAVHDVQARTCKWLLRMQNLVGNDLMLTQEFLAQMMGVRRTSVTQVAGDLQRSGMITYARGRIHITDLGRIQNTACECETALQQHYERIVTSAHTN